MFHKFIILFGLVLLLTVFSIGKSEYTLKSCEVTINITGIMTLNDLVKTLNCRNGTLNHLTITANTSIDSELIIRKKDLELIKPMRTEVPLSSGNHRVKIEIKYVKRVCFKLYSCTFELETFNS